MGWERLKLPAVKPVMAVVASEKPAVELEPNTARCGLASVVISKVCEPSVAVDPAVAVAVAALPTLATAPSKLRSSFKAFSAVCTPAAT